MQPPATPRIAPKPPTLMGLASRRIAPKPPALKRFAAVGCLVLGGSPAHEVAPFALRADAGAEWTAVDGRMLLPDETMSWTRVRAGLDLAEIVIGSPRGWNGVAVITRIDPGSVRFALDVRTGAGGTIGGWTIDDAPSDAAIALNAGQFTGGLPWGWLVRSGVERRPPGEGPLSTAVVFDTAGRVRLVEWKDVPQERFGRHIAHAFQSYPTILAEGRLPDPITTPGRGVDLEHRDIRLAFGTRADGTIVIVLTRFGDSSISLPFGPTVPEMAALMKTLGAQDAVLLDGGLSAQMMVRGPRTERDWHALRAVPLALAAVPVR